jgi:hypothetical protein
MIDQVIEEHHVTCVSTQPISVIQAMDKIKIACPHPKIIG